MEVGVPAPRNHTLATSVRPCSCLSTHEYMPLLPNRKYSERVASVSHLPPNLRKVSFEAFSGFAE